MANQRFSLDATAIPNQLAGAGRYVYELARYFGTIDDIDPLILTRKDDAARWAKAAPNANVLAAAPVPRPLRIAWEQLGMPAIVNANNVDVHHGPHYTLPHRVKAKKIVTVHDMTFFENPEWHERAKVQFFRRAIKSSVKMASGIVAVSQYTANALTNHFGPLLVTVIPHGVDHDRFRVSEDVSADDAELTAAGITGDFIAFVGTIEPRKNVPALIAAFDEIANNYPDLKLVIAGKLGWATTGFDEALNASPNAARIVRPGYLKDAAIPALLRRAKVVAYPSLIEGFGLPALEALACGAALVTTTGSAMEEVVADAAVLVKPGDVNALAEALKTLLEDSHLVAELKAKGPAVAAQFTWQRSGEKHLALYRTVSNETVAD